MVYFFVESKVQQERSGLYLSPGSRYPSSPGVIVGTDPNDPNKWIIAELYQVNGSPTGVILYGASKKNNNQRPEPYLLFEWDPESQNVKKKRSNQTGELLPGYSISPEAGTILGLGGGRDCF